MACEISDAKGTTGRNRGYFNLSFFYLIALIEIGGKSDRSLLWHGRVHKLTNGFEDTDDDLVVRADLAFKLRELLCELSVGGEQIAPCSVKAIGRLRRPPQLDVANCDFKFANSSSVSSNMKSAGKRSRLRRT